MTVQSNKKQIPSDCIYEIDAGKPIYYKGILAYFEGRKQNEKTMPDSRFQSWLKGEVFLILRLLVNELKYTLTVGELGLSIDKHTVRAIDVTIFDRKNFKLENTYSKDPPIVALEIDIKGEFKTSKARQKDHQKKIKQLLDFGVQKIIWIYTDTQKVKVITKESTTTFDWTTPVEVLDGHYLNISDLEKKYRDLFS